MHCYVVELMKHIYYFIFQLNGRKTKQKSFDHASPGYFVLSTSGKREQRCFTLTYYVLFNFFEITHIGYFLNKKNCSPHFENVEFNNWYIDIYAKTFVQLCLFFPETVKLAKVYRNVFMVHLVSTAYYVNCVFPTWKTHLKA